LRRQIPKIEDLTFSEPWTASGRTHCALMEDRRDMGRDWDVLLHYRDMVSYPEYKPGHLGVFRDEARDYRMRLHEARKGGMRVL
jgi:hypothetical protein